MADQLPQTNGYIRWRDLQDAETRIRADQKCELESLSDSTTKRFESAHRYYSEAVSDQMRVIGEIDGRLDNVESVLDQQAGAWTTVKFLIGSNVALTIVGVLTLIAFFR